MRKHLMEGETDFQGIHHICTIGFLVNTLPFTFSCIGTVNVDSTVKDWSLISKWPLARTDCERLLITDLQISLVGNITFFCFFWNYQLNIPYTSRLLVWTNQNTTNRWLHIKTVYVGNCKKSRYLYCWTAKLIYYHVHRRFLSSNTYTQGRNLSPVMCAVSHLLWVVIWKIISWLTLVRNHINVNIVTGHLVKRVT